MSLDRNSPLSRVLVVLMVAAAVAGVVWVAWIIVAVVFGLVGWLLGTVGSLLQRVMELMESVWGVVTLIALLCGGVVGGLLALAEMSPSDVVALFWRPSGKGALARREEA